MLAAAATAAASPAAGGDDMGWASWVMADASPVLTTDAERRWVSIDLGADISTGSAGCR